MILTGKYSKSAFKFALISLGFMVLAIVVMLISKSSPLDERSIVPGMAILISCIFAVIGVINSILGSKEKNTSKKIIGMFINFCITALFVGVMAANALDVYKAFN